MKKIALIIERTDNRFVGRIEFDGDLIVGDENNLEKLEKTMKKLLEKLHGIPPSAVAFKYCYDLSSLFEQFHYLKISSIAEIAGLNASLLRQYVTGNKHASAAQAKKIETAIHKIGRDLQNIQVYGMS